MAEDIRKLITPEGLARFNDELAALNRERRKVAEIVAWAAGNGDRSENGDYLYNKQRLRQIDRRRDFLARRIEKAKLVRPEEQNMKGKVTFGARVTYLDEDDAPHTVRIVGCDEADLSRGEISIVSPVARALMGRAVGQEVEVRTPEGVKDILIESIE